MGIKGITAGNSDAGILYFSIVALGGGWFRVDVYRDSARGAPDLVAHTANYNAPGVQGLIADLGSGLHGNITIDAATAADVDIYVEFWLDVLAHMVWTDVYRSFD